VVLLPSAGQAGAVHVLVLGGTRFVGRAVVASALERGHAVTTLSRGRSGPVPEGVDARHADRRRTDEVAAALGRDEWDAVVDTWSEEPVVVSSAVSLLRGRVGHWGYVSSRSVYDWPPPHGADESAAVVDGDPASRDAADYPAAKRGGELATLAHDGAVLLARPGLVLGPWEDVGRLPSWLTRISRGGAVPAPGPPELPLQLVDARDLGGWMVRCAETGTAGAYNAVSPPGHTTMRGLLEACVAATGSSAELVWLTPEQVATSGVPAWTALPAWLPPDSEEYALHDGDTRAARRAGLRCRPAESTVADTWAWMAEHGAPVGRPGTGLTEEHERALWAVLGS
jgi:2'-hydroxyisoflavone reductase